MIDVIEHVTNPGELLDQALPHLTPGGTLIISTGDAGNVLWRRVFRSRFWYSSFPEHITFPSLRYFHIWHEGKDLKAPYCCPTEIPPPTFLAILTLLCVAGGVPGEPLAVESGGLRHRLVTSCTPATKALLPHLERPECLLIIKL